MGRYALIQVPGLVLLILLLTLVRDWFRVPFWVTALIIGLWVAKDLLLYPLVWRAYDPDNGAGQDRLIGLRGTARERLAPTGYIQVGGELWKAEVMTGGPVEKDDRIRVLGIRGLTLLVEPDLENPPLESEVFSGGNSNEGRNGKER
jgi:membrane protein implicated in regulation of membrane protease activity